MILGLIANRYSLLFCKFENASQTDSMINWKINLYIFKKERKRERIKEPLKFVGRYTDEIVLIDSEKNEGPINRVNKRMNLSLSSIPIFTLSLSLLPPPSHSLCLSPFLSLCLKSFTMTKSA
jgi:hypothetical protein